MDGFDRLWKGSPMAEKDVAHIIKETLKAIKECHSNCIYHKDLRPENILINKE